MTKKHWTIVALWWCCAAALAQTSDYERMKDGLTAQSLPLVNLTVDTARLNASGYIAGEVEISDPLRRTDGRSVTQRYRCLLRYRGATSLRYAKKSLALKLVDGRGGKLDVSLFGIREDDGWILDAMAIDRIRMRNRLCFDLWNGMSRTPYETKHQGRNGTRGVYVELFLNGMYHGLYCLSDKVTRGLLGLKKVKENADGTVTPRGLLYKCVDKGSGHDLLSYEEQDMTGEAWNAWELKSPDDVPVDSRMWEPLRQLIVLCGDGTTDSDFRRQYKDWSWMYNLVDYTVLCFALGVDDNGWKNTYLSLRDVNGGHRFLITPWDMDASMGGDWKGDRAPWTGPGIHRFDGIAPYNRLRLQNMEGYCDSLLACWERHREGLFAPDSLFARMDGYARQLRESGAWQRERERWDGNPVPLTEDIGEELDYVKDWYRSNYARLGTALAADTLIHDTRVPDIADRSDSKSDRASGTGVYDLQGRRLTGSGCPAVAVRRGRKILLRQR